MFGYIIWDISPEIFSFGRFAIRWYGLLFALSFLIGQAIVTRIFKIEGKPEKDLEVLMIYMVLATIVGARLGHCFFYQPNDYFKTSTEIISTYQQDILYYIIFLAFNTVLFFIARSNAKNGSKDWKIVSRLSLILFFIGTFVHFFLKNSIDILKVWEGGLASHGAAIGILLAIFLYSRSRAKKGQSFWWVVDRIVIVVALGGSFIRLGNLMNSEIIGKPADMATSFVFANHLSDAFDKSIDKRVFTKTKKDTTVANVNYKKVELKLYFQRDFTEEVAKGFITGDFYRQVNSRGEIAKHFKFFKIPEPQISRKSNHIVASFDIWVIPRHPAQFYESLSSFLIFLLLLLVYSFKKGKTPEGLLFGIFMIAIFTLRFFYEFLKENQVAFENEMSLNMGQILSLPAIAIGILALVLSLTRKKKVSE